MNFLKNPLFSILAVAAIAILIFVKLVSPAPPNNITIATGSSSGAYYAFAQQYKEQFATEGITLNVRETAGSIENLHLLESGEVDLAFIQGGGASTETKNLMGLASLYYEPLWVFYRNREPELTRLGQLKGLTLSIGADGSGTRLVSEHLLKLNNITQDNTELKALNGEESRTALLSGSIDAMLVIASAKSSVVSTLLRDPNIQTMSFGRAHAYEKIAPYLSSVVLPEGVLDLSQNIPSRDVQLIAPAATLVATTEFHPALASLSLAIATNLHKEAGLFAQPDEFPSKRLLEFPISKEAERYIDKGPGFLQQYLPFWLANLIDRIKFMLLPLVALLIPLIKITPPAYRWQIRRRIFKWYESLDLLDKASSADDADSSMLLTELNSLEKDIMQVSVPLSYADELFALRMHVDLVRQHINRLHNSDENT